MFPSKLLRGLLAAFCVGIALGPLFGFLPPAAIFLLVMVVFMVLLLGEVPRHLFFSLFFVACFFVGAWRYALVMVPELPKLPSSFIRVEGVVAKDVEVRQDVQVSVARDVLLDGIAWDGRVRISLPPYPALAYGDRISFLCSLRKPQPIDGFRYDRYLASQGIGAECAFPSQIEVQSAESFSLIRRLFEVKALFLGRLARVLPEPHASFVSGLLFGGSFAISPELKEAFSLAGVSHVLAASGFNVSLVTFVFLGFATRRLGRAWGSAATILLLLAYVFLAGAASSMVRAALMASVLLVGLWVRRKADQTNVLLLAGSLLLLWNPMLLLNDPGFQLSFGATVAILLLAPRWKSAFAFLPEFFGIRETLNASVAIQAVTLPIVFWHFGSLSLISPLANIFILPFIPALFWSGLGAMSVSAVSSILGQMAAIIPWFLSTAVLRFVQIFSQIPPVAVPGVFAKLIAVVIPIGFFVWHFKLRVSRPKNTP